MSDSLENQVSEKKMMCGQAERGIVSSLELISANLSLLREQGLLAQNKSWSDLPGEELA